MLWAGLAYDVTYAEKHGENALSMANILKGRVSIIDLVHTISQNSNCLLKDLKMEYYGAEVEK